MIDADEYEGHTPAPWIHTDFEQVPFLMNEANERLIFAAPDLLAEVKRLRYHLQKAEELLEQWNENGEGEYYWDGEEYKFRYEGEEE